MIPLYFGPPGRRLFGWHVPAAAPRRGGVVVCGPMGWEYIRSYRSFRHLGVRLSAAGFDVLRFDYDGTGDSVGSDRDPGRVEAWLGSVAAAIDELRGRASLDTVSLFGVRLGATLALKAAESRDDITSIVAWSPCLTGRAYVRELRAFRRLARADARPGLAEGDEEGGGFLLTAETVEALSALDACALSRPPARRVLVLARDEVSNEDRLAGHLRERGVEVELRRLPGYAPMVMNETYESVVPDELFAAATEWLSGDPARAPGPPAAEAGVVHMRGGRAPSCLMTVHGAAVCEEAVHFGEEGRLFGILAVPHLSPDTSGPAGRPAVVLLNNGAVHRVGSQRIYVAMARRLAAGGWAVLRMDLSGLGDSRPAPGRPEHVMYASNTVDDVRAGLDWLRRTRGVERFVLLGLCAGAYGSFHTALVSPDVTGVVLINPQTFYWKEGDRLDVAPSAVYSRLQKYQASLRSRKKWMKLLRGGISLPDVFRLVVARARTVAAARLGALFRAVGAGSRRGTLAADLPRLVLSGTDVFMLFSARNPGLDHIDLHARRQVRRLAGRPNFQIEVIEGPDHTFTPLWSQERLLDMVSVRLAERHGADGVAGLGAAG
jgi:alpha-beta hydrolase superfamily lysophospholipase